MFKLIIVVLLSSLIIVHCANICFLPKEPGHCSSLFTRYYYNPKKSKCDSFIYTGCNGNENNFKTLAECSQTCEANLTDIFTQKNVTLGPENDKLKSSNIKEEVPRSNIISDMSPFGERRGSEKKYSEYNDSSSDRKASEICLLKHETGPCKGLFKKFYYDEEKKLCLTFFYGGCGGNANRFDSAEKCELACGN